MDEYRYPVDGDEFDRALAERYKRLSLLTLDIAAEAGEAAVAVSEQQTGDQGAEFKAHVATMTRAAWAHNLFERFRRGGVHLPAHTGADARPRAAGNAETFVQYSRKIEPKKSPARTPADNFNAALASIGSLAGMTAKAGSKQPEPFVDDEDILGDDFDDDALDKDALEAAINAALSDEKDGAALLADAIGAGNRDAFLKPSPKRASTAIVRAPP